MFLLLLDELEVGALHKQDIGPPLDNSGSGGVQRDEVAPIIWSFLSSTIINLFL